MSWTGHGHYIPGSDLTMGTRPEFKSYRVCLGLDACLPCKLDIDEYWAVENKILTAFPCAGEQGCFERRPHNHGRDCDESCKFCQHIPKSV